MAVPAAGVAGSSSVQYLPDKEGRESGAVTQQEAAADEDADDVGVQKRIAQVCGLLESCWVCGLLESCWVCGLLESCWVFLLVQNVPAALPARRSVSQSAC
jgi:hypothetical protein